MQYSFQLVSSIISNARLFSWDTRQVPGASPGNLAGLYSSCVSTCTIRPNGLISQLLQAAGANNSILHHPSGAHASIQVPYHHQGR